MDAGIVVHGPPGTGKTTTPSGRDQIGAEVIRCIGSIDDLNAVVITQYDSPYLAKEKLPPNYVADFSNFRDKAAAASERCATLCHDR